MEAREIERCIDEFGTDIYRFCQKLCISRQDAEDLYQQTFLKALESSRALDWEENPRAFFFTVAHNLWKSGRRKAARRSAIAPCTSIEEGQEHVTQTGGDPEQDYFRRETAAEIRRIIEELPEKFRIPLTLFYLFDFKVEQIGKMTGKPPGTVKSRLFKGRKMIKKRLEEAGYGEERFSYRI